VAVGQETAVTWLAASMSRAGHETAVRVPGVVDTRTWPVLSAATHSVVVGHETPFSWVVPSMSPLVHAARLAGVALEWAFPVVSTAKHWAAEGQETAVRWGCVAGLSIEAGRLHAPPAGALLERKLPASSTATHNVVDWQLRAVTPAGPGAESDRTGAAHVNGAAAWAVLAPIPAAHAAAVSAASAHRVCRRILVLPMVTAPASLHP
jgi:hypothetical protein